MRYELALFDFDGTLADSAKWFLRNLNAVADELKFRRIKEEDFEKLRGFSSQEVIAYMGLPMWKLPMLMARMRKAAAKDRGDVRLFPGVTEMLQALVTMEVKIGIVSSNSEENIRAILGANNTRHIEVFSCGASLFGKAARMRRTLKKIHTAAERTIYIGDEIRDAVAAREVGMDFGAVAWGFTTAEALRRQAPAMEFASMDEIPTKLRRANE